MTEIALRSIGRNDYAVIDNGHPVGRIRYAAERTNGGMVICAWTLNKAPINGLTQERSKIP